MKETYQQKVNVRAIPKVGSGDQSSPILMARTFGTTIVQPIYNPTEVRDSMQSRGFIEPLHYFEHLAIKHQKVLCYNIIFPTILGYIYYVLQGFFKSYIEYEIFNFQVIISMSVTKQKNVHTN